MSKKKSDTVKYSTKDRKQVVLRNAVVQAILNNIPFIADRVNGLKKQCPVCLRVRKFQHFNDDVCCEDGKAVACKDCHSLKQSVKFIRKKQKERAKL